jgi:hypothetical protein
MNSPVTLKNFLQTAQVGTNKNFLNTTGTNSVKNYLQTTQGQVYTDTLQTQKDALLSNLINFVAGQMNGNALVQSLDQIETILMKQCATIANTHGCC